MEMDDTTSRYWCGSMPVLVSTVPPLGIVVGVTMHGRPVYKAPDTYELCYVHNRYNLIKEMCMGIDAGTLVTGDGLPVRIDYKLFSDDFVTWSVDVSGAHIPIDDLG